MLILIYTKIRRLSLAAVGPSGPYKELFANNKHVDLNNLLALSLENRCLELFFGFLTEKSSPGLRQSFNVERVKRLCSYQDIWA